MGYRTKVQVIERANGTRQFYVICPAPLAEAMELQKGEEIEWVIEDRYRVTIKRTAAAPKSKERR
jgi:bifunctional DNA-binding transcriptional regulator/antitoxin component of YhaV-PrlF toxin-antitoxin module